MAYKAKIYDKKTLTEKVWHNSSMLKYTEMVEDPNENYGDLIVVFNNGSTYRYKNVTLDDYVMMVGGGMEGSNGKAFNSLVKNRGYKYEKIEPLGEEYIERGYEEYLNRYKKIGSTIFVSGPDDYTGEEFDAMIAKRLTFNKLANDDCYYLAPDGAFGGRVQDFLIDVLQVSPDRITIYKKNGSETFYAREGVNVNDDYDNDDEIDQNMTYWSSEDVAIVRDWEHQITRESKNILRRYIYNNI